MYIINSVDIASNSPFFTSNAHFMNSKSTKIKGNKQRKTPSKLNSFVYYMQYSKCLHFNLNGNEKCIVNFEDKSLDLQALISALRHDHKKTEREDVF